MAAALWSLVFTGLGYGFGKTVEHLFGRLPSGPHLIMIGGVVTAIAAVAFLIHRFRRRSASRP